MEGGLNIPAKGSTTGFLLLLRLKRVPPLAVAGGVSFPLPFLVSPPSIGVGSSASPSKISSSSSSSVPIVSCSFISFSYAARWIILLVIFTGVYDELEMICWVLSLSLLSSSSSSAAVSFHCACAMACLIKRVAAALSISVRSEETRL